MAERQRQIDRDAFKIKLFDRAIREETENQR
jgi:hypothetical protein